MTWLCFYVLVSFFLGSDAFFNCFFSHKAFLFGCQFIFPFFALVHFDWLQKMKKICLEKSARNAWFFVECTVDFFHDFWFRCETSNVHFMSRKSDISQGPIDESASKVINYLTTSVKKVRFYIKRCKSISKFDRMAEH